MHLATIGVVVAAIKCGRDQAEIRSPELAMERELTGVKHPLGHGVGKKRINRLSREIVFLGQFELGRVGATGADGHELGLGLMVLPPAEDVRIDLLVDQPLLSRMAQAKITGLGPGCEMEDDVVAGRLKGLE